MARSNLFNFLADVSKDPAKITGDEATVKNLMSEYGLTDAEQGVLCSADRNKKMDLINSSLANSFGDDWHTND